MKKVHLICNAHIDPIWQWDWQEGVSAALATFRSAADLADEFDYIFCHNEVTLYKYVEEYAPDLFQRIRGLIRAGKWRIMGGWYLQPDCNMLTGESFVRQILKGKEYFTEKFGVFPTTAINFDPFGHTRGMVQILQKCGQDAYLFMRPHRQECLLPSEQFIWEGFAGSSVKACRIMSYNSPLGRSVESIRYQTGEQPQDVVCVAWGVGNHGGGPSRKDLADIQELMQDSEIQYVHSDPDRFFAEMQAQARFNRSLHISNPGCYTSMAKVKQAHIRLENELYQAEKLCAVATAAGLMDYPAAGFHTVTEDLLIAEFHDTLPGSCVQNGEANALNLLNHGLLEAERLKTRAFFALSRFQPQAKAGEYPILIFNSQPCDIEENVECEFILADQNWDETALAQISLYDEAGNPVPFQQVKEESNLNLDWRKRIAFMAKLPAMTMSRYSVYISFTPVKKEPRKEEFIFDNGRKYVEVDPKTGLLTHYRLNGVEYLSGGTELVMMTDNANPWGMGAFQLAGIGRDEEAFSLDPSPDGPFRGMKSVQVIENGDIYLGIEAFFKKDNTRARVLYKIYKNEDAVDMEVTLFMGDIDRVIKLKVPTGFTGKLVGQTAFGEDELFCDGRENVALRYVALKQDDRSLALLNSSCYGSSYRDGAIYQSLVRGVSYCAHPILDRPLIPTDRYVKKIDQGETRFSFRLVAADPALLGSLAQRFNQKPVLVNAYPLQEKGCDCDRDLSVRISNPAVTLEALKGADAGEGYVVRVFNNTETPQETEVSVFGQRISLSFAGYEVKTLLAGEHGLEERREMMI